MSRHSLRLIAPVAGLLTLAIWSTSVSADSVSFLPSNTWSGTAAAGSLTIDYEPVAGFSNELTMTISSSLASGENVDPGKAFYLAINPAKNSYLPDLTFTLQSNSGFSQAASVSTGADAFKADGGDSYDILMTYTPGTKAFTTNQSQTYLITATGAGETLVTSDFTGFPTDDGSGASFVAATHIQNTPNGGSGSAWDGGTLSSTPEPASVTLWGIMILGGGAAGCWRRIRRA